MNLSIETQDSFSSLLELAANNNLNGFKLSIEPDPTAINEFGLWYGRQKTTNQMVLQHRTPLMIAATYGSLEVLDLILFLSATQVNLTSTSDKSTALHCAASGGSENAAEAIKQLLLAGADPNSIDSSGLRPFDVIVVSPKCPNLKAAIDKLLTTSASNPTALMAKFAGNPSLPDIKNSLYATDEFRMFSFKIKPCSRAYSHDWTECPFAHPGENARRRDPRKFHYSCVPCADFRKGACRWGDLCEYAHGVFERWLHPAQYRTRLCKDGAACARRVCFFAHSSIELRSLSVSGSAAATADELLCSPSSVLVMSPSPFTPPMSPSARLRPSPYARDVVVDAQQQQLLNDFACFSLQSRLNSANLNFCSLRFSDQDQHQFRSLSSRDLGSGGIGSSVNSWTEWGSPTGKLGWIGSGDEVGKLRRSSSFEMGAEPDISWVHSLVKDPPEIMEKTSTSSASCKFSAGIHCLD